MSAARILIVDDSASVRRLISSVLEDFGHGVDTANSGEEAFERCLSESFDLVVTDLTMGMLSGVQLCRLLRSDPRCAELPIIMLTSADDPRSRFWGRNAGADAYLAKESMVEALPQAVERLLLERPVERNPARSIPPLNTPALERLAQVMDDLLFRAVVGSEARRLMAQAHDRTEFSQAFMELASEVCSYGYLVLRLDGLGGPTYCLHARDPWPETTGTDQLAALGLSGVHPERVRVIAEGPALPKGKWPTTGDMVLFPLEVSGRRLGEVVGFGGTKRLGPSDRSTLEMLAAEVGLVVNSLFLMEQTQHIAHTDELTGLANRRHTMDRLLHEMDRVERGGGNLVVALGDVDHFKRINDTFGHQIGDVVLKRVSHTLSGATRSIDLVGRWGGEEFLAILPFAGLTGGRVVAERLRASVHSIEPVQDGPKRVTISIGVAAYQAGDTAESLVERADQALYRAKERGRNRVEIAGEPKP